MSQSIFPGPIAPENNPPITPEYYQPSRFVISDIDIGLTTLVTTDVDNNYVVGQTVRLIIPQWFGTSGLNEKQGIVISKPMSNQVELNINSVNENAFITSPSYQTTPAQIMAIGDVNSGQINTGRTGNLTYIPGSFINISPQ